MTRCQKSSHTPLIPSPHPLTLTPLRASTHHPCIPVTHPTSRHKDRSTLSPSQGGVRDRSRVTRVQDWTSDEVCVMSCHPFSFAQTGQTDV